MAIVDRSAIEDYVKVLTSSLTRQRAQRPPTGPSFARDAVLGVSGASWRAAPEHVGGFELRDDHGNVYAVMWPPLLRGTPWSYHVLDG